MSKILYVLMLENNNYFVYYTATENEKNVFMEATALFPFVQKYKPIDIAEIFWNVSPFDVDKYVKIYSAQYGIHCVRGGSYSDEILSAEQYQILRKEIKYVTTLELSNSNEPSLQLENKLRYFLYTLLVTQQLQDNTQNDIQNDTQENYKNLLKKYHEIQNKIVEFMLPNQYTFDKSIIQKIQVFKSYIANKNFMNISKNLDIISIYKTLLVYFKHFTKILQTISQVKTVNFFDKNIDHVLYEYPEYIFDNIVYVSKYNLDHTLKILNDDYLFIATELCNEFEGMYYWILNRIEEYEYDLKTIPENIELKSKIVDYICNNKNNNIYKMNSLM